MATEADFNYAWRSKEHTYILGVDTNKENIYILKITSNCYLHEKRSAYPGQILIRFLLDSCQTRVRFLSDSCQILVRFSSDSRQFSSPWYFLKQL